MPLCTFWAVDSDNIGLVHLAFSDVIANFILFIRCGAGISYTIILNISGYDKQAIDSLQTPSQPEDDRIDQLTQTVNTLTAQLTTVLLITQSNNFLVAPLQEVAQAEMPLSNILAETMGIPSPHFSPTIQPPACFPMIDIS